MPASFTAASMTVATIGFARGAGLARSVHTASVPAHLVQELGPRLSDAYSFVADETMNSIGQLTTEERRVIHGHTLNITSSLGIGSTSKGGYIVVGGSFGLIKAEGKIGATLKVMLNDYDVATGKLTPSRCGDLEAEFIKPSVHGVLLLIRRSRTMPRCLARQENHSAARPCTHKFVCFAPIATGERTLLDVREEH